FGSILRMNLLFNQTDRVSDWRRLCGQQFRRRALRGEVAEKILLVVRRLRGASMDPDRLSPVIDDAVVPEDRARQITHVNTGPGGAGLPAAVRRDEIALDARPRVGADFDTGAQVIGNPARCDDRG